ncbi:hypothetical protein AB0I66_21320 [Streptomyces sp. NPDC050439]|uniref:hypothetical protein n=1 Tax=unclassified Streptomyces TaxID=2593676 RepID=UPI0034282E17
MTESSKPNAPRKTVRARIVFSDELPAECLPFEWPDGRNMMEIELVDETLIVIKPESMERPLYDEWNRYLDRVTSQGNWSREPSRSGPAGT